jgi:hypothetical protein
MIAAALMLIAGQMFIDYRSTDNAFKPAAAVKTAVPL